MSDIADPSSLPLSDFDEAPQLLRVPDTCQGDRLDKILSQLLTTHSRTRIQRWIEDGYVQVNHTPAKGRQRVVAGDLITVWEPPAPEALAYTPEQIEFGVIDETPHWIVVDKPAGLVTHPGAGNWHGTLLNGLLFRYPELLHLARAGIVHRLDKETSGLMVVARTEQAYLHFVRQLQARTMGREYLALVQGWLKQPGSVTQPIGRDRQVPVRMSVDRPIAPKQAVTHYVPQALGRVIEEVGSHSTNIPVSCVVCRLETGRTHQIRVHLASIGHPILGDTLYRGRVLAGAQRQMLHARKLEFENPMDGRLCSFSSTLAADMQTVMASILWSEAFEHE